MKALSVLAVFFALGCAKPPENRAPPHSPPKPAVDEDTAMAKNLCEKTVARAGMYRNDPMLFVSDMNDCILSFQKLIAANEERAATLADPEQKRAALETVKIQKKYIYFFSGLRDCLTLTDNERELKECLDDLNRCIKED